MLGHISLISLLATPVVLYLGSASLVMCLEYFKVLDTK